MIEWRNLYRGLLMGASDVVPGVSGGTIALILGIYDDLILSISGLFSKAWKKHVAFLFPLGLGVLFAIILLSRFIEWLFKNHPDPTRFAFIGLILGMLPYLFNKADSKHQFKAKHYLFLMIGVVIVVLVGLSGGEKEYIIEATTPGVYGYLMLAGFVASMAMILPGISGSLVLVIMGAYGTILNAVNEMNFTILMVVIIGIFLGLITMTKVIKFFLVHFTYLTYAVVIGLVIGSIFVIFPGFPTTLNEIVTHLLALCLGLVSAFLIGKMEYVSTRS